MNNNLDNLIDKVFPQNCGDTLKVISKSTTKSGGNYYYECAFSKYPNEIILCSKQKIISGEVSNISVLEKYEFIGCNFLQNCGDTLKVLEKIKVGNIFRFRCEFQTYPYTLLTDKKEILLGRVNNPEIENQTFIGQVYEQFCGDNLKVLRKTDKKEHTAALY